MGFVGDRLRSLLVFFIAFTFPSGVLGLKVDVFG